MNERVRVFNSYFCNRRPKFEEAFLRRKESKERLEYMKLESLKQARNANLAEHNKKDKKESNYSHLGLPFPIDKKTTRMSSDQSQNNKSSKQSFSTLEPKRSGRRFLKQKADQLAKESSGE